MYLTESVKKEKINYDYKIREGVRGVKDFKDKHDETIRNSVLSLLMGQIKI